MGEAKISGRSWTVAFRTAGGARRRHHCRRQARAWGRAYGCVQDGRPRSHRSPLRLQHHCRHGCAMVGARRFPARVRLCRERVRCGLFCVNDGWRRFVRARSRDGLDCDYRSYDRTRLSRLTRARRGRIRDGAVEPVHPRL